MLSKQSPCSILIVTQYYWTTQQTYKTIGRINKNFVNDVHSTIILFVVNFLFMLYWWCIDELIVWWIRCVVLNESSTTNQNDWFRQAISCSLGVWQGPGSFPIIFFYYFCMTNRQREQKEILIQLVDSIFGILLVAWNTFESLTLTNESV